MTSEKKFPWERVTMSYGAVYEQGHTKEYKDEKLRDNYHHGRFIPESEAAALHEKSRWLEAARMANAALKEENARLLGRIELAEKAAKLIMSLPDIKEHTLLWPPTLDNAIRLLNKFMELREKGK